MKWHKMTPFPTTYALCTLDELKAWSKKNKAFVPDIPETNLGTTLTFGSRFVILVQPEKHKQHWDIVDTIIHESVHIFQGAMKYVGETLVGEEMAAYSIAAISTNLLKDYHAVHEKRKT